MNVVETRKGLPETGVDADRLAESGEGLLRIKEFGGVHDGCGCGLLCCWLRLLLLVLL